MWPFIHAFLYWYCELNLCDFSSILCSSTLGTSLSISEPERHVIEFPILPGYYDGMYDLHILFLLLVGLCQVAGTRVKCVASLIFLTRISYNKSLVSIDFQI